MTVKYRVHVGNDGVFDVVDRRIIELFPELVASLGGDPDAMSRAAGIDIQVVRQGHGAISYRAMADLLALAANCLDAPDIGMRLAGAQARAIETPLLNLMASSSTFGEALRQVIRHSYAHSRAASIWLRKQPEEETLLVGHDILIEGAADTRQIIEQVLLVEYLVGLKATGGQTRARKVLFRHQPMSDTAVYRAHFGAEVRFGQEVDAVVYGEHVLAIRMAEPDPASCKGLAEQIGAAFAAHEPPLYARVRGLIMHRLQSDCCTSKDVAAALGLHCRTLHRRLREDGTSFQAIKNQVRGDRLVYLLDRTDLPISEISERLGFAEQSAMTRFCRQALAMSPRERRAFARSMQ